MEPRSPWRGRFIAFVVFVVGTVAFLNGVPQFFDETLPWLSQRINLGELAGTIWSFGSLVVAFAGIATAIYSVLLERQMRRALRDLDDRIGEYEITYGGKLKKRRDEPH